MKEKRIGLIINEEYVLRLKCLLEKAKVNFPTMNTSDVIRAAIRRWSEAEGFAEWNLEQFRKNAPQHNDEQKSAYLDN